MGEHVTKRKQAGVSDTTIRRDLAFVSSMCSLAVRWGWLDTNPATTFGKRTLKEARPRTRFLTHAEYDALLANAAEHVRPAITLAVETGLRKEELFGLTVTRLLTFLPAEGSPARSDQKAGASPCARTVGCRHHPPLRPCWVSLGDRRRPTYSAKQDGSQYADMKKGFNAACRRAKITGIRWHDLRHTFASWFVQSGGDLSSCRASSVTARCR